MAVEVCAFLETAFHIKQIQDEKRIQGVETFILVDVALTIGVYTYFILTICKPLCIINR